MVHTGGQHPHRNAGGGEAEGAGDESGGAVHRVTFAEAHPHSHGVRGPLRAEDGRDAPGGGSKMPQHWLCHFRVIEHNSGLKDFWFAWCSDKILSSLSFALSLSQLCYNIIILRDIYVLLRSIHFFCSAICKLKHAMIQILPYIFFVHADKYCVLK